MYHPYRLNSLILSTYLLAMLQLLQRLLIRATQDLVLAANLLTHLVLFLVLLAYTTVQWWVAHY